jgi:hypothetical protein
LKKLLLLGGMCLLAVMPAITLRASQNSGVNIGAADCLNGSWRLAWLEEEGTDGKVHRADCTGLLVYTPDGHMSVQVMHHNPQPASSGGAVQYSQGGYEASYGTYVVDEGAHTFTYHVEGALVRALIGKDLARVYELSSKQLIVKSSSLNEHWRLAWEHY